MCSFWEEDGLKFGLVINVKVVLGAKIVGAGKTRTVEPQVKEKLKYLGSAAWSSGRMLDLGVQPKPSKACV